MTPNMPENSPIRPFQGRKPGLNHGRRVLPDAITFVAFSRMKRLFIQPQSKKSTDRL